MLHFQHLWFLHQIQASFNYSFHCDFLKMFFYLSASLISIYMLIWMAKYSELFFLHHWYRRWYKISGFCDYSYRRAGLRLLRYWSESVPMGTCLWRRGLEWSAPSRSYDLVKETWRTQNSFFSSQTAVSIWKPNDRAPQSLTILWVGMSGVSPHYCVPPQFREISQTEDALTF